MLKTLLKDVYDFLDHLNRTGYFDKPKLVPVSETKTSSKTRYKIVRTPRGPDTVPRKKGKKLYQNEVMAIYKNKSSSAVDLADRYNVDPVTIYDIKRGKTWSKLTGHQK